MFNKKLFTSEVSDNQARKNYSWYASSDAFRLNPQNDINRFRVVRHDSPEYYSLDNSY